jgi:hypothetical protein
MPRIFGRDVRSTLGPTGWRRRTGIAAEQGFEVRLFRRARLQKRVNFPADPPRGLTGIGVNELR